MTAPPQPLPSSPSAGLIVGAVGAGLLALHAMLLTLLRAGEEAVGIPALGLSLLGSALTAPGLLALGRRYRSGAATAAGWLFVAQAALIAVTFLAGMARARGVSMASLVAYLLCILAGGLAFARALGQQAAARPDQRLYRAASIVWTVVAVAAPALFALAIARVGDEDARFVMVSAAAFLLVIAFVLLLTVLAAEASSSWRRGAYVIGIAGGMLFVLGTAVGLIPVRSPAMILVPISLGVGAKLAEAIGMTALRADGVRSAGLAAGGLYLYVLSLLLVLLAVSARAGTLAATALTVTGIALLLAYAGIIVALFEAKRRGLAGGVALASAFFHAAVVAIKAVIVVQLLTGSARGLKGSIALVVVMALALLAAKVTLAWVFIGARRQSAAVETASLPADADADTDADVAPTPTKSKSKTRLALAALGGGLTLLVVVGLVVGGTSPSSWSRESYAVDASVTGEPPLPAPPGARWESFEIRWSVGMGSAWVDAALDDVRVETSTSTKASVSDLVRFYERHGAEESKDSSRGRLRFLDAGDVGLTVKGSWDRGGLTEVELRWPAPGDLTPARVEHPVPAERVLSLLPLKLPPGARVTSAKVQAVRSGGPIFAAWLVYELDAGPELSVSKVKAFYDGETRGLEAKVSRTSSSQAPNWRFTVELPSGEVVVTRPNDEQDRPTWTIRWAPRRDAAVKALVPETD